MTAAPTPPESGTAGAALRASPRPWQVKAHAAGTSHYLRVYDANGNRVCDFYPHESVGGRGLEQAEADAKLVVALANSPAAAAFEARHATPVEIPPSDQTPVPTEARLL